MIGKLFRGKRLVFISTLCQTVLFRGKRLVFFFYTLSDRTLKVIPDFEGEIILQHFT